MPISVIIITRNEEANIERCLNSVNWADEIVVVDSGSSDRTVEIARRFTDKVFVVDWMGYAKTKAYAVSKTRNSWIFWIDDDEEVSQELQSNIAGLQPEALAEFRAFKMPRRTYFLGRWIKNSGWYPDYVTRLFRKDYAQFSQDLVHEKLIVQGDIGKLNGDLLHYTDNDLSHYFKKFHRYTKLAAIELNQQGRRMNWFFAALKAWATFVKIYFLKLGFLDGVQGFQIATLTSFYILVKYFKLWELQRRDGRANLRPRLRKSEEYQHLGS
ncbi:MAG: glycosyltransferase family 2 protein [bacterium]